MTILFVFGINDISRIHAVINHEGKFMNVYDGNCFIRGQLPLKKGIASWLLLFGKGVKQRSVDFTSKPSLIFNEIADADSHRGALERCMELCSQVDTTVINHPEKVLRTTRDRVSELLQGIPGVTMPNTVRFNPGSPEDVFEAAESENFDFPYIVRVAGDHGGTSMIRVNSMDDYHALPGRHIDYFVHEGLAIPRDVMTLRVQVGFEVRLGGETRSGHAVLELPRREWRSSGFSTTWRR